MVPRYTRLKHGLPKQEVHTVWYPSYTNRGFGSLFQLCKEFLMNRESETAKEEIMQ